MPGIYMASKAIHGDEWENLKMIGYPICSTWIHESGLGKTSDWSDLWTRCVEEAATADALIVFRTSQETLKGAWVEVGAALARGVPVFAVGCEEFSVRHHPKFHVCENLEEALILALRAYNEACKAREES